MVKAQLCTVRGPARPMDAGAPVTGFGRAPAAHGGIGLNLRPLAEGAGVCRRIFRTGDVTAVDARGAHVLYERLGVRYYLDLRTKSELLRYGEAQTLNGAGIATVRQSIASGDGSAIASRPTSDDYARYYLGILEAMVPGLPDLFAAIVAMEGAPFLFGCHAGKDRTGLLAMLLLHICGADAEVIVADYERSGEHLLAQLDWFRDKWERKGEAREEYAERLKARGTTLRQVIMQLQEDFGGPGQWLLRSGVPDAHLRAIRERYAVGGREAYLR